MIEIVNRDFLTWIVYLELTIEDRVNLLLSAIFEKGVKYNEKVLNLDSEESDSEILGESEFTSTQRIEKYRIGQAVDQDS